MSKKAIFLEATKVQRDKVNPYELIGNFNRTPENSNAPRRCY